MPNDTPQPTSTLDLASAFVAETGKLRDDLEAERKKSAALARELEAAKKARTEAEAARDAAEAARKSHPTAERTFKALTDRNDALDECAKLRAEVEALKAKLAEVSE